jgi:peptide/nickel transport system permease protein
LIWIYTLKRVLAAIPTLIGVTLLCFFLVRVLPGNPAYLIAGPYASEKDVQEVIEQMGLKKPLLVQYWTYIKALIDGDLGRAWFTSQPVSKDLIDRFPATLELANFSFLFAFLIGVPLGIVSAVWRDSWLDHFGRVFSILGVSMPLFWSGLLFIFFFYSELKITPPPMGRIDLFIPPPDRMTGMYVIDSLFQCNWSAFKSSVSCLFLPTLTLGLSMFAPILRMVRSSMLEVLQSRYVKTAIAYGIPRREVIYYYALKNALLPIITTMAIFYGFALSGMILVETIFGWPGIGLYAINAILNSDYAAIQGIVVFVTFIYIVLYILVDIIYASVDPRISF